MKGLCSLLLMVCSAGIAIGDEPLKPEKDENSSPTSAQSKAILGPPWLCPLFPIGATGEGIVYWCDYFEDACINPSPQMIVGDYPWPWEDCNGTDCIDLETKKKLAHSRPFRGWKHAVSEHYMHKWEQPGDLPGQDIGVSCFPAGPARRHCKVNNNVDRFYLRVTVKTDEGDNEEFYAKLLEIDFDLHSARGNDPGPHQKRLIAFEMERAPTGGKTTPVEATFFDAGKKACVALVDEVTGKRSILILRVADPDGAAKE